VLICVTAAKPMRIFTGSLYSIRQCEVKLGNVSSVSSLLSIRKMKMNVMVSRGMADRNRLWARSDSGSKELAIGLLA